MPAAKRIVIEPPEGLLELNANARHATSMTFDIVTIFPAMIEQALAAGVVGRAIERGTLDVKVHDLRDFTTDRHRVVDDVPYGGGPGMVLKPEPLFRALDAIERRARRAGRRCVLTSPQGTRFTQAEAERLSRLGARGAAVRPIRGGRRAGARAGRPRRCRSATTC